MVFEYLIRDWWQYIAAFFLVMLLILCLTPAAKKAGLVDQPSLRKPQILAIPLVGGIAIFIAFSLSLLLFEISLQQYRLFMFSAGLLVIIGVLDDYIDIPPFMKFVGQGLVAIVLVVDGTVVGNIGAIFGANSTLFFPTEIAFFFSVIAIVGLVNAFNMLDGLDGLAAGVGLVATTSLLFLYLTSGRSLVAEDVVLLLLFSVCVAGFLPFNFPAVVGSNRQIFLGDAGSMLLGLMVAYISISWSQPDQLGESRFSPTVAPWLVAVPIMDMVRVIGSRLYQRKPVFQARRDHIHHVLLNRGYKPLTVLAILLGFQLMLAVAALLVNARNTGDPILFWGMFPVFMGFVLATVILSSVNPKDEEGIPG